jgi:hypothetical protein
MTTEELILWGKVCPYCKNKSKLIDSSLIYGVDYGRMYYCEPCQAWVGTHKGTDKALGRLANAELRLWKQQAHKFFDPLWHKKKKQGMKSARMKAYEWLSREMHLPFKKTHIGMFDVEQCKKVVIICKQYYK